MDLQNLVEYIAKNLVDDPSQVKVELLENANAITLELHVAQNDMGRVIGKGGKIANSIRTLVRVAAAREGKRVNLEIV
jgi:hypothetical protein